MFTSHMVLQAEPQSASLFGWSSSLAGEVRVEVSCVSGFTTSSSTPSIGGAEWFIALEPINVGERCFIVVSEVSFVSSDSTILSETVESSILLEDVLFGDVWFCSGQSNMGWSLGFIENGTEEVAEAARYPNIRLYKIERNTSDTEMEDQGEPRRGWTSWAGTASDWPEDTDWGEGGHKASPMSDFSAICFLYAKQLANVLGDRPFGLIASAAAGTRIEGWTQKPALDICGVEEHIDDNNQWNSNTFIYNAMIHPFTKIAIKGALWYQGEANSGWEPTKYSCLLHEMFAHWRSTWASRSDTSENFPVGIVQLGPLTNKLNGTRINDGEFFPLVRWHQSLDFGVLPNPMEENMFMAVSMDTYYQDEVHPRNKQLPGKRLGVAGLAVAYGIANLPTKGPFPTSFQFHAAAHSTKVDITWDESPLIYNPIDNSGFFFCCGEDFEKDCAGDLEVPASDWELLPLYKIDHNGTESFMRVSVPLCSGPSSLAYLWTETPATTIEGLPIYSVNEWRLPASPWWVRLPPVPSL